MGSWYKYCIYTIRHSEELEEALKSGGRGRFTEKKLWKTGKAILEEAKTRNLAVPIFFGTAEKLPGLYYMAILTSVELHEKEKRTEYAFKSLKRLQVPRPLNTLILKSSGKPLPDKYIRPYAICLTPRGIENWPEAKDLSPPFKFKKNGEEPFTYNFKPLDFSLKDFWSWAFSDLVGNTVRGILAEYIVAKALGLDHGIRTEWRPFDLITKRGLKIEVKSAAYIQTWHQRKFSHIRFSIRKTRYWDEKTGKYQKEVKRQADVYIFCLLAHRIPETLNPMELGQWEFYILPTRVLDKEMGDSREISLSKLKSLGAIRCRFKKLRERIEELEDKLLARD